MKKFFTLSLAVMMLLTLCLGAISCNGDDGEVTSGDTTPAVTTPEATEPDATEPDATEPEETEPEDDGYSLHIKTAADLIALNEAISNNVSYDDYTIYIDNDIDMGGVEWKSMNGLFLYNAVFEGKGHTISNLNIVPNEFNTTRVGFIDQVYGENITFRNITFKNFTTTGGNTNGVATIIGYAQKTTVIFNNVHVLDSKVITDTKYKTGASDNSIGIRIAAFVGYSHEGSEITIDSCSVKNFEAEGFHNLASFVGYDSGWLTYVKNSVAENVRLNFAYCYANAYTLEQGDKYIQVFYGGGNWEDTLDTALANGNTYKNVVFFDMDSQTEIDPVTFRTVK